MINKDIIGYQMMGNSRQYFSKVSKEAYFGPQVRGLISDFFSDSPTAFASLFTADADLSRGQLEELQRMIDDQLKKTK
jgi:predicted transcriptional regulator